MHLWVKIILKMHYIRKHRFAKMYILSRIAYRYAYFRRCSLINFHEDFLKKKSLMDLEMWRANFRLEK